MDIRVRVSGGQEAVARVWPGRVDLSEHKTLVALPEDLRRLRELTLASRTLEALPAWVGELSCLEVLRVGVQYPWVETCKIGEITSDRCPLQHSIPNQ